jgi:hypothetical protein
VGGASLSTKSSSSISFVPYITGAAGARGLTPQHMFPLHSGFEPRSGHVGYAVGKVTLGQFLSEYFGFPCQFSFHRLLHTHHHLSSGAGTVGQIVADVPSGLSLTPPQETKLNY